MTQRLKLITRAATSALLITLVGAVIAPPLTQAAPAPASAPSVKLPILLPPAVNSEESLQPNTLHLLRLLEYLFPYYKNGGAIYGYRQDPIPDHPSGQALDVMMNNDGRDPVSVANGNLIAAFLMANATQLGVDYMVWRQHIWYPGKAWREMNDRGNWTDNHMNHVHVKVFGDHKPSDDLLLPADITITDGQLPDGEALRVRHEQRVALQRTADDARARVNKATVAFNQQRKVNADKAAVLNVAQRKVNSAVRDSYILGMDSEMLARSIILLNADSVDAATLIAAERILRTEHEDVEASLNALTEAQRALLASTKELSDSQQAFKDAQNALNAFDKQG